MSRAIARYPAGNDFPPFGCVMLQFVDILVVDVFHGDFIRTEAADFLALVRFFWFCHLLLFPHTRGRFVL